MRAPQSLTKNMMDGQLVTTVQGALTHQVSYYLDLIHQLENVSWVQEKLRCTSLLVLNMQLIRGNKRKDLIKN